MGDYSSDQERDYSDLSDENRQKLNHQSRQTARDFYGDYNPNDLGKLEESNNSTANDSIKNDRDLTKSENLDGRASSHISKVGQKPTGRSSQWFRRGGKVGRSKKALIAAATGISLFGGIAAYTPILIASTLPIHVAETLNLETNSIAKDLNTRSEMTLAFQTKKGYKCKNAATCSFQNASQKQIDKFRKNGWKIDDIDIEDVGFGKKKINRAISPDGEIVDSDTLPKFLKNPKNRTSLKKIYNGYFYSFRDNISKRVAQLFSLFRAPKNAKSNSETEIINSSIEQANKSKSARVENGSEDKEDIAEDNNKNRNPDNQLTPDDIDDQTVDNVRNSNKLLDEITEAGKDSTKIAPAAFRAKINGILSKVGDNPFQLPCGIFQLIKGVSISAKSTKAIIIGSFAFYWLSMFNKLKAGDATSAEVSAMGNLLTGTVTPDKSSKEAEDKGVREGQDAADSNNQTGNIYKDSFAKFIKSFSSTQQKPAIRKAATDSQGWQSIAYGSVIKKLDNSAGKWVSGAYILADAISAFLNVFNYKPVRVFCNIATSNFVESSEFLMKLALIVGIIGTGGLGAIALGALHIALEAVVRIGLPQILGTALQSFAKTLAGNVVDKFTRGEDFGNALVSGTASFMSKNSIAGGGALLTKDQAVAKYLHNQEMIALEAEEKRQELSPLDPSSRHTFVGSIIHATIPYQQQLATIGGFLPSVVAIARNSFASIIPTASASNAANFRANMDTCNDELFLNVQAATDIFCNPYASIPRSSLKIPIDEIIDKLTEAGEYNPNKEGVENDPTLGIVERSRMDNYKKICVDRTTPVGVPTEKTRQDVLSHGLHYLGLHDDDDEDSEIRACITSDTNPLVPYYSSFFTDIRVKEGLEDGSFIEQEKDEKHTEIKDFAYPTSDNQRQILMNFGADGYSEGVFHNGIDIQAPEGSPVYAFKDGTVITARDANNNIPQQSDNGGCGGMIYIDHGTHDNKPLISQYCHLQKGSLLVKNGDKVKAGQQIARSGNTGASSSPHLHFGLRKAKNPALPNRSPNARKEDITKYYYDPSEILKEYKKS